MKIENWTFRQWHWLFLAGIAFVVTVYVVDYFIGRPFWIVTRSFHLAYESNIPTWYSSGLLFVAGVNAFMCYRTAALKQIKPRAGWLLLAFFLIGLSCDEVACLHESVGDIAASRLSGLSETFPHTIWPIVIGPVVLVVLIAMAWILYSHMKGAFRSGVFMLVGISIFIGSALILEMAMNLLDRDANRMLWDMQLVLEETGEMLGSWLIGLGLIIRNERYVAQADEIAAAEQSEVQNHGQAEDQAVPKAAVV